LYSTKKILFYLKNIYQFCIIPTLPNRQKI